jgi:hypothetical protein
MKASRIKQRELAPKLGIDPTTLNNFLNRQSKALGGRAVALACTIVDIVCDGTKIGRVVEGGNDKPVEEVLDEPLVLEFDGTFELGRESEHPTIILRKPVARQDGLRLSIKRIG